MTDRIAMLALTFVSALTACDRSPGPDVKSQESSAPVPSAAPVESAIDACIRTMKAERASREDMLGQTRVLRACAAVFKEERCQKAHAKAEPSSLNERNITLARECASAYCPKLSTPKPVLCDVFETGIEPAMVGNWSELRLAIWRLELGEKESQRLAEATSKHAPWW